MPPQSSSSRVNDGSQVQHSGRIVKFERQVALPAAVAEAEKHVSQSSGQLHPVSASQHTSAGATSSSSSTASTSSVPNVSVSSNSGTNLKININQRSPASVGGDGLNFDQTTSYNKPNYNDPNNYKYNNDGSSDSHFHNQYPPTVDEPHVGYGGYFVPSGHSNNNDNQFYRGHSHSYDQSQASGQNYLPPETINQRPVVTKTIQIAQPAIKTKKYEVRHPAIQKEFYDIEERVVIKPAGTVVVELERPVAKIPKGESILPLGHPHPAVAGAYMNNGHSPSFSNILYSAAGSSNTPNHPNNQFNHGSRSSAGGSTIASSITSTPSFDQNSKAVVVEANLNKQYNGENQYTAASAPVKDESKNRNREVIVVTDGQGNQRQVSSDQFSYPRESSERTQPRSGYNLRSYSNQNISPQRTNFQASSPNHEGYNFEAEYINVGGNGNIPRESKPARLEQAPVRMEPVLKHQHNIALPPSQHKIYLTQKHAVPESRYVEERAHVQEIKPYLLNHPGPMVVYASTKNRPEVTFRQSSSEYQNPSSANSYGSSGGNSDKVMGSSRLEISAPYAQMRYNSEEHLSSNHQNRREFSGNERDGHKYGKLILEDKSTTEKSMHSSSGMNMTEPQTQIEINIPHSSQSSNKAITVSSTIRPMMSDGGDDMHNANLEISITNNGEPKKEQMPHSHMDDNADSKDKEHESHSGQDTVDCDKKSKMEQTAMDHKFMRLVEAPSDSNEERNSNIDSGLASNIQTSNVDISNKGLSGHSGHVVTPGSRVIAATPAPKEASAGSESFHKRRIVVNHPFQTVREVVEHEPYTNYHEVQVNEPASPALYHSAAYFQTHGSLRQSGERNLREPVFYN